MALTFRDLDPPATDEECELFKTPNVIAWQHRRKAWLTRRAQGPTGRLRVLAYRDPGAQERFTAYVRPAQLSAIIAAVRVTTGAEFSCATEHSVIDGAPCAVIVTLISKATRGRAPDES